MNDKANKVDHDLRGLLTRQEDLHPDLKPYVQEVEGLGEVLRHPLVYSVPHTGALNALVNLQLQQKRAALTRAVERGDYRAATYLHERPYRISFLYDVEGDIDDDPTFYAILGSVLIDTENLWSMMGLVRDLLERRDPAGRKYMMTENDRETLADMEDEITVFRGCSNYRVGGLSWTISEKVARWFAGRFNQLAPVVARGKVKRADVIAYFAGRNEQEIFVLPETVYDITVEDVVK